MFVKRNIVCVSDSAKLRIGSTSFFGNLRQGDGEKHGKYGNLKNLVFCHGLYDIFRENMQQKIFPSEEALRVCGACSVATGEAPGQRPLC